MSSVKVSAILTNHNYGRFVTTAVESALSQTHSNLEVIVVDDGSMDDSRRLLAMYAKRARIIHQDRSGQTKAINAGFAASSGEFVPFLDSDDALFPEAIESALSAWQKTASKVQFPLEILSPDLCD